MLFKSVAGVFAEKHLSRSAAAMSYYLTLSAFPFILVLYELLNTLNISVSSLVLEYKSVIPSEVMAVVTNYVDYVKGGESTGLLMVGILGLMTSCATAMKTLVVIMSDIHGERCFRGIWGAALGIISSLVLLLIVYVSAVVIVLGERLPQCAELIGQKPLFLSLWRGARFILPLLMLVFSIAVLYRWSLPKGRVKEPVVTGALLASMLLVAVGALFSRVIKATTNYPLVYGSLASLIVFMLWIFVCSNILILGNVVNYALYRQELYDTV